MMDKNDESLDIKIRDSGDDLSQAIFSSKFATPLVQVSAYGRDVFIKDESCNPYNTIKDRKISALLSRFKKKPAPDWIVCTTSFNVGASLRMHYKEVPQSTKVAVVTDLDFKVHRDWFSDKGIQSHFIDLQEEINLVGEDIYRDNFDIDPNDVIYDISDGVDFSRTLGYKSLASEIALQVAESQGVRSYSDLERIMFEKVVLFVPFGSGDILIGMHAGFRSLGLNPRYTIVTIPNNPLGGLDQFKTAKWGRL